MWRGASGDMPQRGEELCFAAMTRRPSSVSIADSEISAGNVLPSRRRAESSIPEPIARGLGRPRTVLVGAVRLPCHLGDQDFRRLAQEFVALVTEQALGLGARQRDPIGDLHA
jgi:hypothetical protein